MKKQAKGERIISQFLFIKKTIKSQSFKIQNEGNFLTRKRNWKKIDLTLTKIKETIAV